MSVPAPLTPPDSDLRDFQFMPLDVVRFAQSDLVAMETPEAVLAAIMLWGAAWHGRPAGSLTDDDRALSQAAGYGRAVGEWQKVRDGALHGFIKCSDGRLYHPVVAEKVIDSWDGKLRQRHRTYCAAVRKHNERDKEKGSSDQRALPAFEAWLADGRPTTVVLRDKPAVSRRTDDHVAYDKPNLANDVTRETAPCHAVFGSKGQGEGEGEGYRKEEGFAFSGERVVADPGTEPGRQLTLVPPSPPASPKRRGKPEPTPAEQAEFDAFWTVYPRRVAKQPALEAYLTAVRSGTKPSDLFAGAQCYAADRDGKDPDRTAHAATWINARRWTDEIASPPAPGALNDNRRGGWSALDMAAEAMTWDAGDAA